MSNYGVANAAKATGDGSRGSKVPQKNSAQK